MNRRNLTNLKDEDFELVVELVAGLSPVRREMVFRQGIAVPIVAIGTHASWPVSERGVARNHVVLAFNGRTLLVGAPGRAPVHLNGVDLRGGGWVAVPTDAAIDFGDARLLVAKRPVRRPVRREADTIVTSPPSAVTRFAPLMSPMHREPGREEATLAGSTSARRRAADRIDTLCRIGEPPPTVRATAPINPLKRTLLSASDSFPAARFIPPRAAAPAREPIIGRQIAFAPRWPRGVRASSSSGVAVAVPPVELAPVEVEKRIEPAPRKLDPAAAWRSASRVKKAIFVLTAPMMIALLVSSARGHASQSPSVASTATKPASTSPMATTKGSAPAASMTTPTRGPAAQPAASSPSKPTLPTAKNELALKDRTPERRALDAAAVGDYPSAAEQYAALASEHPDNPAFNEAARILNAKRSR